MPIASGRCTTVRTAAGGVCVSSPCSRPAPSSGAASPACRDCRQGAPSAPAGSRTSPRASRSDRESPAQRSKQIVQLTCVSWLLFSA